MDFKLCICSFALGRANPVESFEHGIWWHVAFLGKNSVGINYIQRPSWPYL